VRVDVRLLIWRERGEVGAGDVPVRVDQRFGHAQLQQLGHRAVQEQAALERFKLDGRRCEQG
jgi:hypothetical protein